ncbi:MAG: protein kinase domain-containing protein [Bacteroidota bacterium]
MIGQTISHYKILEKLGEGGMGIVYKAQDTKLDRIVALKFLPPRLSASEQDKSRFMQEAKAAAMLNHPNICTIHAIEESDGQQFIVMEYVDGNTLRDVIGAHRDAHLRVDDAISYAIQIGEALQEAHSKGIVHRDIKSENIMVNSKKQIKVMDFGLARLKGSMKLTRTSSTLGTLAYMAPEQLQGAEVDARSDIFAFGVVLFETLTGKLPFRGEHEAAIMYSIVNEECDTVQKHRDDVSPELDRIIHRALEKDPNDRYQHIDDMTSELRKFLKQSSRITRPVPTEVAPLISKERYLESNSPLLQGQKPPRTLYFVLAAAAILLIAFAAYMFFLPRTETIDSLAVLPFVNVGGDPNTEYLSDGMTESIINSLTRIPGLRVIPRSTVFRFKGKDNDPQEIGTQLNVRAVLMGRIVQRDDNLNLQLDLIDVDRQSQVYGNQYQHRASEILAMQEEIVSDLLNQLGVTLSKQSQQTVTKRYTDNVDAYKLYLQGRYYWNKRRALEIQKAIECFNQALALDASYALAYVGLADCYALLEQYAGMPGKETYPKAVAAATRALEIDNTLAEAHTTLAFASFAMWNWDKGEEEFKLSISLNPNYPTTYHWYSILLQSLSRHEEALRTIKRAQELDPLSPVIGINVGLAYYMEGQYERALQEMDAVLAIDSLFGPAYSRKSQVNAKLGRLNEAFAMASKAVEVSGRSSEAVSFLGYCYGLLGKRDEALKIAKELEERYAIKTSTGYYVARVYVGLDDRESIFKWLNLDMENHAGTMIWLNQDRELEPYRSDPRFIDILEKIGMKK